MRPQAYNNNNVCAYADSSVLLLLSAGLIALSDSLLRMPQSDCQQFSQVEQSVMYTFICLYAWHCYNRVNIVAKTDSNVAELG